MADLESTGSETHESAITKSICLFAAADAAATGVGGASRASRVFFRPSCQRTKKSQSRWGSRSSARVGALGPEPWVSSGPNARQKVLFYAANDRARALGPDGSGPRSRARGLGPEGSDPSARARALDRELGLEDPPARAYPRTLLWFLVQPLASPSRGTIN